MSLRFKMNLALIITLFIGTTLIGVITFSSFKSQAENNVLSRAELMLDNASAIRLYMSEHITPLLARQSKRAYLPQSVPAHAVRRSTAQLEKQFPFLRYNEASINPTNPENKATAWEQEIIRGFIDSPDKAKQTGVTPTGTHLYLSRPVKVNSESCQGCHGDPAAMPLTLRAHYKNSKAFGWKNGQVVAAQFVKIPLSVPLQMAQQSFKPVLGKIILIAVGIAILAALLLNLIVVQRVQRISKTANAISLGSTKFGDFTASGSDEIATLERSFNRMRRSLSNAIDLLEEKTGNYTRM